MKLNAINFDEVPDFEALPKGEYVCQVFAHEIKPGKKAPFIEWQLLVTEPEQYKGRKLFHNTSLAPNSLGFLKSFLKACNYDWGKSFNPETDCSDVYGCEVVAKVDQRMYNGEPRNKVTGFIPVK